jgi:hypothetical protein
MTLLKLMMLARSKLEQDNVPKHCGFYKVRVGPAVVDLVLAMVREHATFKDGETITLPGGLIDEDETFIATLADMVFVSVKS